MTTVPSPPEWVEFGADAGRGNLLGVQPWLEPPDYASAGSFAAKLDGYLQAAAQKGRLAAKTIVVFPEYLGTWLVAAGEKPSIYAAETIAQAMRRLILSHPLAFGGALLRARAADRPKAALFRFRAGQMARMYQSVFSGLAKRYGATIVAGSIILPAPEIAAGRLVAGDGPLQNVAVVFRPGGSAHERIVRKAFPIADELRFTAAAPVAGLPVFETPAGRLGVLICADSWYPQAYAALKSQGVDLLAVPSFLTEAWDGPWRGYTGAPPPADVDPADADRLTEGEAWRKYALPGRLEQAGAACGLNVFLRGRLWDMRGHGHSLAVTGRTVRQAPPAEGALLVNLWLE